MSSAARTIAAILVGTLLGSGPAWAAPSSPSTAGGADPPPQRGPATDDDGEAEAAGTGRGTDHDRGDRGGSASAAPTPIVVDVVGRTPLQRDPSHDATRSSGDELRRATRPSTLEEIAARNADVYVSGRGLVHGIGPGASGAITVRGLGGSPNTQVVVVENGIVDAQGIFGHPIPDAYVPSLIDEVLVVKGGDSVLYGSGALGGAIVIRNRWRRQPGFELYDDTACGSFQTLRETASFLGRFGDWDGAGALQVLRTEGHRPGAGGSTVVGQAAARVQVAPDLRLSLHNKLVHLVGSDPGPVTHPHPDHDYEVWRDQAALRLTLREGWLRLTMTPHVTIGLHRLHDGFRSEDHTAGTHAEARLNLHRTVRLLLGVGADRVGGRVENRITAERQDVRARSELFAFQQLTLHPIEPLTVTLGTRNVHSTQFGPELAYKAGARWRIVDGLYLRSRLARSYRHPTLRELYLPMPTANPDLRPERALTADLGLGYRSHLLELGATGYRTEADDLIKYFGAWPSAEVLNIDHLVIWGVEARAGLTRLGPLSLLITADLRDVGRYTRQNPTAKLNAHVEVAHDFDVHHISTRLSGEWIHGLYMGNYERDPLDDVFFLDLAASYTRRFPAAGVSAEPYVLIRNLLNRPVELVAGYPLPGLHLLGGLRLEFDHG